ncbi:hypothetical protein N9V29_00295 [Flavobacteriales bacterium]|nr:hypothetical protein [Flavobacteriales bacterium]
MAGAFVYGQPDPKSVVGLENHAFTAYCGRVCDILGLELSLVLSDKRHHRVVKTRQMLMAIAAVELQWTLMKVGDFFGRDHTTVVHAKKEISNRIELGDGGAWFEACARACSLAFEETYKTKISNLF